MAVYITIYRVIKRKMENDITVLMLKSVPDLICKGAIEGENHFG